MPSFWKFYSKNSHCFKRSSSKYWFKYKMRCMLPSKQKFKPRTPLRYVNLKYLLFIKCPSFKLLKKEEVELIKHFKKSTVRIFFVNDFKLSLTRSPLSPWEPVSPDAPGGPWNNVCLFFKKKSRQLTRFLYTCFAMLTSKCFQIESWSRSAQFGARKYNKWQYTLAKTHEKKVFEKSYLKTSFRHYWKFDNYSSVF